MAAGLLFAFALFGVLTWVTLTGRDAWPFSAYPMFSSPRRPDQVSVCGIAFETLEGKLEWWRPHYFRYVEKIGRRIGQLVPPAGADALSQAACALARRRELRQVIRLVEADTGLASDWKSLQVVRRSVVLGADGQLQLRTETIDLLPRTEWWGDHPHA